MIHINDRDIDAVSRAIAITMLALGEDSAAIDCMIHLWYSAFLTPEHIGTLHQLVVRKLEEVLTKIQGKAQEALLAKTFQMKKSSIRIILTRAQWEAVLCTMKRNTSIESALSKRNAVVLHRKDHLHRHIFSQLSAKRVASWTFRHTGILLPFGHCSSAYTQPNP